MRGRRNLGKFDLASLRFEENCLGGATNEELSPVEPVAKHSFIGEQFAGLSAWQANGQMPDHLRRLRCKDLIQSIGERVQGRVLRRLTPTHLNGCHNVLQVL
ncbi:hypothetical protein D3C78_1596750 [compost metagenome]